MKHWLAIHAHGLAWLSLAGWLYCWGWAFGTAAVWYYYARRR
jgi:hypothetical protein